jgi:hypothetical protein
MERRFSATLMVDRYEMLFASLCRNQPPQGRGFAGALHR